MGDFGETPFVHTPSRRVLVGRGGRTKDAGGRPEGDVPGGAGGGASGRVVAPGRGPAASASASFIRLL